MGEKTFQLTSHCKLVGIYSFTLDLTSFKYYTNYFIELVKYLIVD
jgi:hypothetical protein